MKNNEIKVAKVIDKYRLVLNKGRHDINEGDRFLIYSTGEMIYDPDTKEELESVEIPKGIVVVTNVQDRISFAESDEYIKNEKQYDRKDLSRAAIALSIGIAGAAGLPAIRGGEMEMKTLRNPDAGDLARKVRSGRS